MSSDSVTPHGVPANNLGMETTLQESAVSPPSLVSLDRWMERYQQADSGSTGDSGPLDKPGFATIFQEPGGEPGAG
jgi:hypothetical protein